MSTSDSNSALPYLGSRISLISNADIRYEGVLHNINPEESTVALRSVKSFGTELRKHPEIPASSEIYDFIVFRGKDIKDLTVCSEAEHPKQPLPNDPAIVSMNIPPQGGLPANVLDPNLQQRGVTNLAGGMRQQMAMGGMGVGGNMNQNMMPSQTPMGHPNYQQRQGVVGNMVGGQAQRGGGRGGILYNNNGRGGRGQRQVVGELPSQPNHKLKDELSLEFDFETNNSKFQKPGSNGATPELPVEGSCEAPAPLGGYDKKFFFDNISCETLDRQQGRDEKFDRQKQRALDMDTFGASAENYRPMAAGRRGRGRGRTRGRGYRGGRGGGYRFGGYGGRYSGY